MSTGIVATASLILLLVLIMAGVHLSTSLMFASILGVFLTTGRFSTAMNVLAQSAWGQVRSYMFGVIPLFVLMGLLANLSGASKDLYDAASLLLKRVRGGVAIATVVANAIFAAITGVTVASAAIFTKIALPQMTRLKYDRRFALGTIAGEGYDYKFSQYYVPLRDNFDREEGVWDTWDDLSTNYTPSYAMLNCNAAGYTIETPRANEASTRLFECGFYGIFQYYMEHKEEVYLRQMEFFLRGLNNTDASKEIAPWYVDYHDKQIPVTDMRPLFEDNGKFFCEYWVIPVDADSQRSVGAAYDMAEFLIRNDIKVSKLTADTTVNDTTYKAGSFVVDMHQAKRNYANCVLYSGVDASYSGPELDFNHVSHFHLNRSLGHLAVDRHTSCITRFVRHCPALNQP